MSNTYANTATLIGRGLRAAVVPGCLPSTTASGRTGTAFGSTSTISAVPATHGFAARTTQAPNAMKQGSHPPRAKAALS